MAQKALSEKNSTGHTQQEIWHHMHYYQSFLANTAGCVKSYTNYKQRPISDHKLNGEVNTIRQQEVQTQID